MIASILPGYVHGATCTPVSKSDVHRALICAALSDGKTCIRVPEINNDICATMDALIQMGAKIEYDESGFVTVRPIENYPANPIINCMESGSTLRFLLPVLAALGGGYATGSDSLVKRPIRELCEAMRQSGLQISGDALPITVSGTVHNPLFTLPGNVSSQYVTGLLLAAPLFGKDVIIRCTSPLESAGYVDMTISVMHAFGVSAEKKQNEFYVAGGQHYKAAGNYIPEGDWSSAAFMLTLGALNGDITVRGLDMNSAQPDKAICDCLIQAGAKLIISDREIRVEKADRIAPIDVNVSACPDLAPILAVLCAHADGISQLRGTDRLRLKESDRLEGICRMVQKCGAEAEISDHAIMIRGQVDFPPITYKSSDHRMVMAAAVAGLTGNGAQIQDAEAVCKSYPDFFNVIQSLGGRVHVINDRE